MNGFSSGEPSPLRDYFNVLRRRKLVLLEPIVIVPILAFLFATSQAPRYEASAEVLLGHQSLAAALTGIQDPSATLAPDRLAQTAAQLARVPTVAGRALAAAHLQTKDPSYLLDESSVTAQPNADLLDFTVRDRHPAVAARLATAYARQFTLYQHELTTQALHQALRDVTIRLKQLKAQGDTSSAVHAELVLKQRQLSTLEALEPPDATVVRTAASATQIAPRPFRDAVLGLGFGIVLGIGLAFGFDALSPRIWRARDVASELGLPLLGRIPRIPSRSPLLMVADPDGPGGDAFRMLKTNLELTNLLERAKVIMVSSALEEEGKTTTVANLAITLAQEGQHVVLVDLDLRQPQLDTLFDIKGHLGLTDIVKGDVSLARALTIAPAFTAPNNKAARASSDWQEGGALEILTAGTRSRDVAEFRITRASGPIIEELRKRADVVLLDTSPLLAGGDALALTRNVDALLLVARLDAMRPDTVDELKRMLEICDCPTVGVVVTRVAADDVPRYGYGTHRRFGEPEERPLTRRRERQR
jgi:succinoglycan biosynthesis transport protein ExoP